MTLSRTARLAAGLSLLTLAAPLPPAVPMPRPPSRPAS